MSFKSFHCLFLFFVFNSCFVLADSTSSTRIEFTAKEQAYLNEHPTITLTGDPNWLPYEGVDEHGNYIGIVPEILDIFEQRLGITIERKLGKTWQQSVNLFTQKQADVISETYGSPIDNDTKYSDIYLASPIVIVMRDSQSYVANLQSISHLRIARIKGYGYTQQIQRAYPNITYLEFENIEDGLEAVAVGQTDVLLATLAQASYHIANLGTNNVRIVGSTSFDTKLALGVHSDNNMLIPIFNKALRSITQNEKQKIITRWGKAKYASRVDYVLVAQVLIGALIAIALIILWYQKLLREINARQEAQAQYEALLDLLPTQVMIINTSGIIESANSKVIDDFAVSREQIIGKPFINLLKDHHDFSFFSDAENHGQTIKRQTIEFFWQDTSHSMMLTMLPITFNKQQAFLGLAVDITERVFMEHAIIEAKNAAIDANQAKSSFLANMSHEIRTPMNAIIGFTELLFDQARDPKMISYIKTIRSAGNSLLLLINDILDLSKIEAGKIHLQCQICDLYKIIEEIGHVFELEIKNKKLDFIISIDENVPKVMMLDEPRLRQILFNLVGNAVKFTDKGHITLKISVLHHTTENIDLTFSVIDTGIGINKEDQSLIFESFMQPQAQNVSDYGGSGLGLTISRRLIELMNGELQVTSELAKGSNFSFNIPNVDIITQVTKHQEDVLDDNDCVNFNGLSVLVADDVEDNRQLLVELLPLYGLTVDIARDGQEAVLMSQQKRYDLILLDIRMPKMNGYEAAINIKRDCPKLPVIAVTASVMLDDHEIAQREEFDGYLRKPVLKKDIIKELKQHLPFVVVEESHKNVDTSPPILSFDGSTANELKATYMARCRQTLVNNNIDEISRLIESVESFAGANELPLLTNFCQEWQRHIDSFDVIEIQRCNHELIGAIESACIG